MTAVTGPTFLSVAMDLWWDDTALLRWDCLSVAWAAACFDLLCDPGNNRKEIEHSPTVRDKSPPYRLSSGSTHFSISFERLLGNHRGVVDVGE